MLVVERCQFLPEVEVVLPPLRHFQQFRPVGLVVVLDVVGIRDREAREIDFIVLIEQELRRWIFDQIGKHTSELQSLMRISYAVFCLKKKKKQYTHNSNT